MDIKDFILIGGSLLIASVVAHGFWLAWRAHRDPLRLDITPEIPRDDNFDEMTLLRGELPNGGARVVEGEPEQVSFELEAPPVLIETPPPRPHDKRAVAADVDASMAAEHSDKPRVAEDEAPLTFGAAVRVAEEPMASAAFVDEPEGAAAAETTYRGEGRGISVEPIVTEDPREPTADDGATVASRRRPAADRVEADLQRPMAADVDHEAPAAVEAQARNTDSIRVDPIRDDSVRRDPIHADRIDADGLRADHNSTEQMQAEQMQAEQMQADPIQADPIQADLAERPRQGQRSRSDARSRSQPRRIAESDQRLAPSRSGPTGEFQIASEVLVITVLARRGERFHGTDLLETLVDNDLRFGDMNIFHRLDGASPIPLFSVANAVEPGTFDLSDMTSLETPGISFFLQLGGQEEPSATFDDMLDVARDVAARLGGDLKDENMSVMTGQTVEHYRQRIVDFALKQMSKRA